KAVSRKDGEVILEREIKSAKAASQLALSADRISIDADGKDLSFITVDVLDENGVIVPRASDQLTFDIEGPGKIVGMANGDHADHQHDSNKTHRTSHGRCYVMTQEYREKEEVVYTATDDGLKQRKISLRRN